MDMCPKSKAVNRNFVTEIVKGVFIALLIAVASACVYGILIQRQTVSESSSGIWVIVTLALASLIGCLISSGRIGEKRIIVTAITAAVLYLVLLATGILFFDGSMRGLGVNLSAVLVGAGISCLLSIKRSSKKIKIKRWSR
jgi:putative membrane protein (TIGR04086 family)